VESSDCIQSKLCGLRPSLSANFSLRYRLLKGTNFVQLPLAHDGWRGLMMAVLTRKTQMEMCVLVSSRKEWKCRGWKPKARNSQPTPQKKGRFFCSAFVHQQKSLWIPSPTAGLFPSRPCQVPGRCLVGLYSGTAQRLDSLLINKQLFIRHSVIDAVPVADPISSKQVMASN